MSTNAIDINELAQEIRRIDGKHELGAAALAEALAPYLEQQVAMHVAAAREGDAVEEPAAAGAMKPIPVKAAGEIAKRYGYDQVIVLARRVDTDAAPGGEHVTTYGRNPEHCRVASQTGNYLKHKIMGWPQLEASEPAAPAASPDGVLGVLRSYSAAKAVTAAGAFVALLRAYRALLASHRDYTESQGRGWPGPEGTYPDRDWALQIERDAENALARAEG